MTRELSLCVGGGEVGPQMRIPALWNTRLAPSVCTHGDTGLGLGSQEPQPCATALALLLCTWPSFL